MEELYGNSIVVHFTVDVKQTGYEIHVSPGESKVLSVDLHDYEGDYTIQWYEIPDYSSGRRPYGSGDFDWNYGYHTLNDLCRMEAFLPHCRL